MARRILVTPATDAAQLERLARVLEEQRACFDEWRWWLVGEEAGVEGLRALAAARPWVHVDEMQGCRASRARYHRLCTLEDAVYVRLDQGTSWLAPGFLDALAAEAVRAGVLAAHATRLPAAAAPPTAAELAGGDWRQSRGVARLRHSPEGSPACFAWAGGTYASLGAVVGTDEEGFLFGSKTRGLVNVSVDQAAYFVGDLAPEPVAAPEPAPESPPREPAPVVTPPHTVASPPRGSPSAPPAPKKRRVTARRAAIDI